MPTFSFVYGLSISHVGLRHTVIALYKEFEPPGLSADGERSQEEWSLAQSLLQLKLDDPMSLNGGDLFTAFLLILRFRLGDNRDRTYMKMHIHGFFAIMRHLTSTGGSRGQTSDFRALWATARTFLLICTSLSYDFNNATTQYVIQESADILGPITL